jgi:hypothetical protein
MIIIEEDIKSNLIPHFCDKLASDVLSGIGHFNLVDLLNFKQIY